MKTTITLFILLSVFSANAQWVNLPNAPQPNMSGRFDDLYFTNDSTGYAVNGDGFIYKTTDYGASWTILYSNPQYYFRSVEFINDSVGFAGSLDNVVLRTTNAGATWFNIASSFPQQIDGICGIGHHGDTIIMAGVWSSPAFVMRSADGGATWSYQQLGQFADALIDVWFNSPDTVFVGGQSNTASGQRGVILRSTDAGLTWSQVGLTPQTNTYVWKLQFTSPSIGYASLEEFSGSSSHIYKTTDGGSTWTSMTVISTTNIDMEGIGFVNDSVGWVGGWTMGQYQTMDGGNAWRFLNFGENINRYVFINDQLGYAAGYSIYKFTGLTTGIENPGGHENYYVHSLIVYPNPAIDCINLEVAINKSTRAIVDLYDEEGKLINTFAEGRMEKNLYSYSYDVSALSGGNYYLVLRTNEHFITKKVVIQ